MVAWRVAFFLIGIVPVLRLFWVVSVLIFLAMVVYFVYSAVKIAVEFHDSTALRLFVLYFVRAGAWFDGAIMTTARYLAGKDK
jgi:hypothetical protein